MIRFIKRKYEDLIDWLTETDRFYISRWGKILTCYLIGAGLMATTVLKVAIIYAAKNSLKLVWVKR